MINRAIIDDKKIKQIFQYIETLTAKSLCILFNFLVWSFIRLIRGVITMQIPFICNAGAWNIKLLPEPIRIPATFFLFLKLRKEPHRLLFSHFLNIIHKAHFN